MFGGCPITSYVLYRDDGSGSDVNIPIDVASFASRPNLFSYDATLDSSFTGKKINIKIQAINAIGSVTSKSVMFVLAAVPGKPSPAP